MSTPETTEAGTHEFDFEFVFKGVNYNVEGTTTNTLSEADRCDHGFNMPHTVETTTEIELLSAIYGEDFEYTLTDEKILIELEAELYNY